MRLDGNDLAGTLSEVFVPDMTVARGQCAACGRPAAVGEVMVYDGGPGQVARCPTCEAVLLRVVRAPDRVFLDLRGVTCLEIALP